MFNVYEFERDTGMTVIYKIPVCRGSFALNTACGRCERCHDEAIRIHGKIPRGVAADLGQQVSGLIGAMGIYLGDLGSDHVGDKDRLRRAMTRALHSSAFIAYMDLPD